MKKRSIITIIILVCMVCLTRIPLVTKALCEHDSVNFALALEKFDIQNHQPHPPGYLVYIGLAKLINLFVSDANTSLIILSIIFSCLSVALIFLLGKAMFNYRCGIISALFLISSPLFWAYGELALSYTADTFAFLLAAYIGYQIIINKKQWISILSITLGFAGGLRQNSLFFLLPLWVTALIYLKSWKETFKQVIILGIVCLAWFIPLMVLSGGLAKYRIVSGELYKSSVLPQVGSFKTPVYAGFSVLWGLGCIVLSFLLSIYRISRNKIFSKKLFILFSTCWGAIILFSFIIYTGKPGHILVFLPCLILLSSLFVYQKYGLIEKIVFGFIFLLNIFLFLSVKPLSGEEKFLCINTDKVKDFANFWVLDYSNKGFREEEKFKGMLVVIKQNFSPDTTAIITLDASPRITKYYLRDFTIVKNEPSELPLQINTIIQLSTKGFTTLPRDSIHIKK